MRRAISMGAFLLLLLLYLVVACSDAAQGNFESAAELDQQAKQLDAVDAYFKAHKTAPDSHHGKLAYARAEVLLLELGAQNLQTKQWEELAKVADRILELDAASYAGNVFKGYALYGQGQLDQADQYLKKATGPAKGVSPPSDLAIEATAKALFRGAEAGARAALSGSVVDERFLKNTSVRLENKVKRQQTSEARRTELAKAGTLDAMATLLDNYSDSPEAAKVREPYALKVSAKLKSVKTIGPPTVNDPDPITTLEVSLSERVPEVKAAKKSLARIPALRKAWEEHYSEQLENIDEMVAEYQQKAIVRMAKVISDKCAPLHTKVKGGDATAIEPLEEARQEALKMIPNGLAEEELQDLAIRVHVACSPPTKATKQ